MSLQSLLSQRCTIRRPNVSHTNGLTSVSFADVATDVPCLVQENSGVSRQDNGGRVLTLDAVGFFLPSVDIRPDAGDPALCDVIELTAPAGMNGRKYAVRIVAEESGKLAVRTVDLERVHHAT